MSADPAPRDEFRRRPPGAMLRPAARQAIGVLLSLALAGPGTAVAGKGNKAPLNLALEVAWGDASMGPESLREDVESGVLARLEQAGCYATVGRSRPPGDAPDAGAADLRFQLTLSDLDVREDWEVSIAERTSPNQPPGETENRVRATVGFDVSMELSALPEALRLRTRTYRHEETYQPLQGEDPREAVRDLAIADLAREASAFVCKGAAKIPAQIARARAAAAD